MSFVDRARAARLLGAAGLDALVIAEPEGFHTVSGVAQGVAGLFRRAGAGFAVLPADPDLPVGVVVGDLQLPAARAVVPDARSHPLWMEHAALGPAPDPDLPLPARIAASWAREGRPAGFARPATFDLNLASNALRDVLGDRGLLGGRLGFDLGYVAASDADTIRQALPDATVLDGSPTFDRLRMVKTAGEIARLTLALDLSEAGLRRLGAGAREGHGAGDLHALFREGIEAEARARGVPPPPSWDYIGIGPEPWGSGGRIGPGTVVKADVGCVVEGYSSDTSRNYLWGKAPPDLVAFHGLLEAGFDAALSAIRPGAPLRAAHAAATAALERGGLRGFSRGHFGHGLGHALFNEQWPFISAGEDTRFEPGMVMALEVPVYVSGLGGFNLEDQLIVEADGPRLMTTLPRALLSLGG